MAIFERFLNWAEDRFDDVKVSGKEIQLNSIFTSDDDHKLWCSPSGGKKKRPLGVFHCFKTERKGSLAKLIQIVDGCGKEDAVAILKGQQTIADLERQLEEFFKEQDVKVEIPPPPDLTLPAGCVPLSGGHGKRWWRQKAEDYLKGRNIPPDEYYVCTEDKYKFRIVIPYYDRDGKLIYFNCRHMGGSKLKYLGPPKEIGVGKGDVVYFPAGRWHEPGSLVHVCEGEFNAKSLALSELQSAACGGKNMTEKQAIILSQYRICLCLDGDKAGKAGTTVMSNAATIITQASTTTEKLFFVHPPAGYNDWNDMYVALGPAVVHHYIKRNARPVDFSAPMGTAGDAFKYGSL